MEFILVTIVLVVLTVILGIVFRYSKKKIEEIAKDDELDKIASKYPENIEICKDYLKMLKNENVVIEEDKDATNCLYIAAINKILIANMRDSFTRIQTIAHECLHSVQDKRILSFNFIFSNFYFVYFFIISILAIMGLLVHEMMFLSILLILSMIYLLIRNYLETDAMIKAKFLAKEYMLEKQISEKEEIEKIIAKFDELNTLGIQFVNYNLFLSCVWKILVFCIICIFA